MTLEDRIRQTFGTMIFENLALVTQLEAARAEIEEVKKQLPEKDGSAKPSALKSVN